MTSYSDKGVEPEKGKFLGFDHLHFYVGNAPQAAAYYVTRFGFTPYAYRGLETGSRETTTYVLKQSDILFAFSSALTPAATDVSNFTSQHGDAVKEIAFLVDDCRAITERAIQNGAKIVKPLQETEPNNDDDNSKNGSVITSTIQSPWDPQTYNTFIQRNSDPFPFLPTYHPTNPHLSDPLTTTLPSPNLHHIDHCVVNVPPHQMEPTVNWYIKTLSFHRFWSVDDKQLHTKYSSLKSIVVSDYHESIKMPINEPAAGLRKSQIQEFIEYFGGAGVQHIALNTSNILHSVSALRQRGVGFIKVPKTYYEDLRKRLATSPIKIEEDLEEIEKLGILVDFDEKGYLLQIFTKPLQDRPTLFIEVIQRYNHEGFGVGNFKSLFEAIEREQAARGNL